MKNLTTTQKMRLLVFRFIASDLILWFIIVFPISLILLLFSRYEILHVEFKEGIFISILILEAFVFIFSILRLYSSKNFLFVISVRDDFIEFRRREFSKEYLIREIYAIRSEYLPEAGAHEDPIRDLALEFSSKEGVEEIRLYIYLYTLKEIIEIFDAIERKNESLQKDIEEIRTKITSRANFFWKLKSAMWDLPKFNLY